MAAPILQNASQVAAGERQKDLKELDCVPPFALGPARGSANAGAGCVKKTESAPEGSTLGLLSILQETPKWSGPENSS